MLMVWEWLRMRDVEIEININSDGYSIDINVENQYYEMEGLGDAVNSDIMIATMKAFMEYLNK